MDELQVLLGEEVDLLRSFLSLVESPIAEQIHEIVTVEIHLSYLYRSPYTHEVLNSSIRIIKSCAESMNDLLPFESHCADTTDRLTRKTAIANVKDLSSYLCKFFPNNER